MKQTIIKAGRAFVGITASTVNIVFAVDDQLGTPASFPANYQVVVTATPEWATSCRVTNPSVDGLTINFGTAAGAYGDYVHWIATGYWST